MSEELTEICNLRGVLQHMEGETDGRKAGVWSWLEELGIEIQINVFQLDQRKESVCRSNNEHKTNDNINDGPLWMNSNWQDLRLMKKTLLSWNGWNTAACNILRGFFSKLFSSLLFKLFQIDF